MKLKNPNCICSEGGFFFIYEPFMDYPPRNAKSVHGSRNKDCISKQQRPKKNRKEKLLFQSIPGDYKNPGKIPCSFASFLHERGVARGNRVT